MTSRSSRQAPRARRGFSLVEVIVAIVLLGIALSSLGVLAFGASRKSMTQGAITYRSAVMNEIADRYEALSWTDLGNAQNYDSTIATGPLPHRRIVEIVEFPPIERRVRIVIRPTNTLFREDTTIVRRFRYTTVNPLNMATSP